MPEVRTYLKILYTTGTPVVLFFVLMSITYTSDSYDYQRATLPPTWTPTFTPTNTHTPTATFTPPPSPTLNPQDVCAGLIVNSGFDDGKSYKPDSVFALLMGTEYGGTQFRFLVVHRLSGENRGMDIPGTPLTGVEIPMSALPRHGLYDWTVQLLDTQGMILCEDGGYFFAQPSWLVSTSETDATPFVVIVTATP